MTWCGSVVRLWYVNASQYGCSRDFNTQEPDDQIEIIKLLHFFTDERYAHLLCGHWNIAAQKEIIIEADSEAEESIVKIEKKLDELHARPGPFRTRTAVWADQDKRDKKYQGKVTMVKASWVAPHLTKHELMILRKMKKKRVNLPNAPHPIGTALLPAGFWHTTSDVTTDSALTWPARSLCVLVTKHCIGILIPLDIKPHDLVYIHQQLAEQLLALAEGGFHYRDLNEGNIRLLRGTDNILLIVDFGNVRLDFERRGHHHQWEATATIARARDDTRSANPIFLPSSCAAATQAIKDWEKAVDKAVEGSRQGLQVARSKTGSELLQAVLAPIQDQLRTLQEALRDSYVYSHRYIDDLESSLYLHVWQVSVERRVVARPRLDLHSFPFTLR
ncbi:hypothetical protein BCV69DRAFT_133462 [Microstroma glucosiphilum]|uniref:Fungal-type protein kinase domain-containing protein n=1 Tax=Pseudomicrostroma glucosiphilum TaxID=1684307 RepID=A0A316UG51_9BASI|nr:hypothetical protein BCV69DRAFT_133462 [Pseudomicrostroma glucosiphilum]PWN22125.1 hypothetical protein BCV69DRAFT_133462 [Pseudomicrostroma glucosiphilum]